MSESHARLFELLGNRILPTHHAFTLLRSAILPRLSFLSRVVPPEILLPAASWFDDRIRSIFCERLRLSDLSGDLALRVSLPVRFGGFGLRSVVRSSPIAYACSLASAARDIVALHSSALLSLPSSSPSSLSSVAPSSSVSSSSVSSSSLSSSSSSVSLSPLPPSFEGKQSESKVRVSSGLGVSGVSAVGLDVRVPLSTPQSESLGRLLASLPSPSSSPSSS